MHTNLVQPSWTTTVTVTEPKAAASHYILKLKPQQYGPKLFLQEMNASDLFSIEQKNEIQSLIDGFSEDDAPIFLSLFLSEILQPAYLECKNIDIQERMGNIEDEVRKILISLLPFGTDIDDYIESIAVLGDEASDFMNECIDTNNYFQEKKELLFHLADKCNESIENAFENLKNRLMHLIQLKDSISNDNQTRQQSIDNQIVQISKELEMIAQQFQTLGKQIQEDQTNYLQLLKECNELLGNIKRF